MSKVTVIVALSVFVLLMAFALPAVITAVNGGTTQEIVITSTEDQTLTVTAGLTVTADALGQNDATITLRDTQTGQEDTHTITEGNTTEFTVRNESINVTNEDSTSSRVELMINYPRTYGWGEGGKAFLDQFELIMAVVALLIVAGTVRGVLNA